MDKLDSSTGQVYSLKIKTRNISGANNEIVKNFEYSSTSINAEKMVAPLWVQWQTGHKEVTANETPEGGEGNKLTVKKCDILGLSKIISNLHLSEDSS